MRKLASFVDTNKPHAMGICDIESGDALAIATRFALEWAYRGRQALFWKAPFRARAVQDRYLPASAARLFERRGLLIVDADCAGEPCMLAATQLSTQREAYIPQLRFVRSRLRGLNSAVLFAGVPDERDRFSDLGFRQIADGIFTRGFALEALHAASVTV